MDDHTSIRLVSDHCHTPLGDMTAVAAFSENDQPALVLLEFSDNNQYAKELQQVEKFYARSIEPVRHPQENAFFDTLRQQLDAYFQGDLIRFSIPLAPIGTSFQKKAWKALLEIPYNTTVSYGRQAELMGLDRRSVRAVARANGANKIPILIPCHRVIGSDGTLTGYSGGLERKKQLLRTEQKSTSKEPGN